MWSGKFISIYGIKGCDTLFIGDKKFLADDADKNVKGVSEFIFLNKTAYIELILAQKTQSVIRSLKKQRKNPICMETQDKHGCNFQVFFNHRGFQDKSMQ